MSLRLKPEVRFYEAAQALPIIALVVERAFDFFGAETVITSAGEGQHKPDSLHYLGLALDFRLKHLLVEHRAKVVQLVKEALPQCDVLHEGIGTPNEHLHVEWDPK